MLAKTAVHNKLSVWWIRKLVVSTFSYSKSPRAVVYIRLGLHRNAGGAVAAKSPGVLENP